MNAETWFSLVEMVLLGLTLLATVAVAGFVAWQTQRHFALQRSQDFIERFNGAEMAAVRRRVDRWVSRGQPPWELSAETRREREADADPAPATELTADLTVFTNFFQELGTAMRHKTLHPGYTWDVFGGLVSRYWGWLRPYVYQVRYDKRRGTLFQDFEWLADQMAIHDRRRGKTAPPRGPVLAPQAFLFGYGSLFSPESIARTAERQYERTELIPAWLEGYRREWSAVDRVVFDGDTDSTPAVFLSLRPDASARCNGVLIPLDPEDWAAFDRRERVYDRVEVTDRVTPRPPAPVYTYVGREGESATPESAVLPARYERLVEDAVSAWSEFVMRDFRDTTPDSLLPRREGAYRFVS